MQRRIRPFLAATAFFLVLNGCASAPMHTPRPLDPSQRPSDLVSLAEIDPSIVQEMRYQGIHNFLGRPVAGYKTAACILTRDAAVALKNIQAELKVYSLTLKVYDCYRPQAAVDDFVEWANNLSDTKMKIEFYPKVDKTNLFHDGYIAEKSGHSRGSTMDLTIVPLPLHNQSVYRDGQKLVECFRPAGERYNDNSLDMGTGYDCFDPLAHTANPSIGLDQKRNRLLLKTMMEKHGFRNLPEEWWHYTLIKEPYPETFFNFPIEPSHRQ